jgi:hypothetical protein
MAVSPMSREAPTTPRVSGHAAPVAGLGVGPDPRRDPRFSRGIGAAAPPRLAPFHRCSSDEGADRAPADAFVSSDASVSRGSC